MSDVVELEGEAAEFYPEGEYDLGDGGDPVHCPEGYYSFADDGDGSGEWLLEEDDGGYELVIE